MLFTEMTPYQLMLNPFMHSGPMSDVLMSNKPLMANPYQAVPLVGLSAYLVKSLRQQHSQQILAKDNAVHGNDTDTI
jgi:hypothetical protein